MSDAAAKLLIASYKAWLAEVHDIFDLHPDAQQALLAYFEHKGTPLQSRPTAVKESQAWVDYWKDVAQDAGLTERSDVNGFVRWLQAVSVQTGSVAGEGTRASTFMAVMNNHGVTVTPAMRMEAEAANMAFESGNEHAQSTCINVRWMFYTGELADGETTEWIKEQEQSLRKGGFSEGCSQRPTIDIRRAPRYMFLGRKGKGAGQLLETALLEKTGYAWSDYRSKMVERLNGNGYALAVNRFNRMMNSLEKRLLYNPLKQREFLFEVFFNEFLGLGLPADWAPNSYDIVMSQDPSVQAQQRLKQVPTFADANPLGAAAASMFPTLQHQQDQAMMSALAQSQMLQFSQPPAGQMGTQMQLPVGQYSALPVQPMDQAMRMMAAMQMGGGAGLGLQQPAMQGLQGAVQQPIVETPPCAICVAMGLPNTMHRLEACGHYLKAKRSQHDSAQAAARRAKEAAEKNDAHVPK